MKPTAGEAAARVFASGFVGQGPRVDEFEIAFANMVGLSEAPLGVNSCTSAIDLALHLSGVGPGTEGITTPITCTATNAGIATRGAQIAWADVDPLTGNIDPKSVAERITPKTKAIISVDWGGRACDYATLRQFGLPVIQDATHSLYHP